MKERPLLVLSLALSTGALSYATWLHLHAEAFAMDALHRKEAEMVRAWAPRFEEIYRDMIADPKLRPNNPKTIAELLDPLVHLMEQVGDSGTVSAEKKTGE